MTQTTSPRPLTIAVEDLRRGDVVVTPEGVRCYAAFDLEVLASGDVRVWTAVSDQDAGRPRDLTLHAGTTVLIAGPEDLPDNDQATEDRQVAGEAAAAAAEWGTLEDTRILGVTPAVVSEELTGAGLEVIDDGIPAPGIARVIVAAGQGRTAAAVLIGAGYNVVRSGDTLTVAGDD